MTDYTMVDVAEKPYLYVERHCSMNPEDISKSMGEAFGTAGAFVHSNGIAFTGSALAVYYTYDPEKMTFRAGFFVSAEDMQKATGDVQGASTPAGNVLKATHIGPYSKLRDTYGVLMQELEKQGKPAGAPTWEVYVDDPDSIPEDNLRTDIYMTLV